MKAQAVIRLNFSSEKLLNVVLGALKPETETSSTSRSNVDMKTEGQMLILDFRATDTSALRAALNSYLRLIGVAMNIQKLTE
ncbi:MAG TPA: KEOPS complex subunit Pcc1 [Acidobacteriota bacterium]|nr:KEOPS complex subunit Pcc1 [Acidobacteriota bacterium]